MALMLISIHHHQTLLINKAGMVEGGQINSLPKRRAAASEVARLIESPTRASMEMARMAVCAMQGTRVPCESCWFCFYRLEGPQFWALFGNAQALLCYCASGSNCQQLSLPLGIRTCL